MRAAKEFFDWLAARSVTQLTAIESVHVVLTATFPSDMRFVPNFCPISVVLPLVIARWTHFASVFVLFLVFVAVAKTTQYLVLAAMTLNWT